MAAVPSVRTVLPVPNGVKKNLDMPSGGLLLNIGSCFFLRLRVKPLCAMASADVRGRALASLAVHYGDGASKVESDIWESSTEETYVERYVAAMCAAHDPAVRAEVAADVDAVVKITDSARAVASKLPEAKSAEKVVYNSSTRCRACKSNNVMERSVQTRSADEAATIKYVCQACDAEWSV